MFLLFASTVHTVTAYRQSCPASARAAARPRAAAGVHTPGRSFFLENIVAADFGSSVCPRQGFREIRFKICGRAQRVEVSSKFAVCGEICGQPVTLTISSSHTAVHDISRMRSAHSLSELALSCSRPTTGHPSNSTHRQSGALVGWRFSGLGLGLGLGGDRGRTCLP